MRTTLAALNAAPAAQPVLARLSVRGLDFAPAVYRERDVYTAQYGFHTLTLYRLHAGKAWRFTVAVDGRGDFQSSIPFPDRLACAKAAIEAFDVLRRIGG